MAKVLAGTLTEDVKKMKPSDVVKTFSFNNRETFFNIIDKQNFKFPSSIDSAYASTESPNKRVPLNIYAQNFSDHINPQSIYTKIRFKTGENKDTKIPIWEDLIAHKNNTYFKDLNIEDNGGVQKISVNLYDKEFTNLERIIRRAVYYGQLGLNTGTGEVSETTNMTPEQAMKKEVLQKTADEAQKKAERERNKWLLYREAIKPLTDKDEIKETLQKMAIPNFLIKQIINKFLNIKGYLDPMETVGAKTIDELSHDKLITIYKNILKGVKEELDILIEKDEKAKEDLSEAINNFNSSLSKFIETINKYNANVYTGADQLQLFEEGIDKLKHSIDNKIKLETRITNTIFRKTITLNIHYVDGAGEDKTFTNEYTFAASDDYIDNKYVLYIGEMFNGIFEKIEGSWDVLFPLLEKGRGTSSSSKGQKIDDGSLFLRIGNFEERFLNQFTPNTIADKPLENLVENNNIILSKAFNTFFNDEIKGKVNSNGNKFSLGEAEGKFIEKNAQFRKNNYYSEYKDLEFNNSFIYYFLFDFSNNISEHLFDQKGLEEKINNIPKLHGQGYTTKITFFFRKIVHDEKNLIYLEEKSKLIFSSEKLINCLDEVLGLFNEEDPEEKQKSNAEDAKKIADMEKRFAAANTPATLDLVAGTHGTIIGNMQIQIGYTDENKTLGKSNNPWNALTGSIEADARWNEGKNLQAGGGEGSSYNSGNIELSLINQVNQNVIRSEIYEYFITNVKSKITQTGLFYTIEGFSLTSELINKYKIVQKYATLRGTPINMMGALMRALNVDMHPPGNYTTTNEPLVVLLWGDSSYTPDKAVKVYKLKDDADTTPQGITKSYEEVEMSLPLGGSAAIENPKLYKPLAALLNDFCAKFPPLVLITKGNGAIVTINEINKDGGMTPDGIFLDSKGNKIYFDSNGDPTLVGSSEIITRNDDTTYGVTDSSRGTVRKYNLTWACRQLKKANGSNDSSERIVVWFYFKRPRVFKYIRNYDWGLVSNSVIKSMNIENASEFSTMASIIIYHRNAVPNRPQQADNFNIGSTSGKSITKESVSDNRSVEPSASVLVNSVVPNVDAQGAESISGAINLAYLNGLYKGEITVIGDPGLFTTYNLCPYIYPIVINIYTPRYVEPKLDKDGKLVESKFSDGFERSYMSGVYVITGFKHSISTSGYTTTIGVMRYPGLEEEIIGVWKNQKTNDQGSNWKRDHNTIPKS